MASVLAKQRKRDAAGNLQCLADEVGVESGGRKVADLSATGIDALRESAAERASAPEQRQRLDAAAETGCRAVETSRLAPTWA